MPHEAEVVGVIHKCKLCGRLRNLADEPRACPHCYQEGVICIYVDALVLQDVKHDRTMKAIEDERIDCVLTAIQLNEKRGDA